MSIWTRLLTGKLDRLITQGRLRVTLPDGTARTFGEPGSPEIAVTIHDQGWLRRIVLDPSLQLGEAYMHGGLSAGAGGIYGFLDLVWKNLAAKTQADLAADGWLKRLARRALRKTGQWNDARRAKKNVSHHYDIGNDLYRLFLDADMQYSCAYYPDPSISLDEAQRLKREHITAKLCLEPEHTVLDIGCGWGGMALQAAKSGAGHVDGITLSERQLSVARDRAAAAGLTGTVDFRLEDYRDLKAPYDRIVSVGMLEHVGLPQYGTYFAQISRLLKKDGVALIHTIGRPHGPGVTNPWINRRIFPGGYIPALSELLPAIERAGLTVLDIEILRLHYAETLKAWRERFMANAEKARAMHGEAFVRMWEFYLACSEVSFRHGEHVVFQLQLGHDQQAVPLTRDYLYTDNAETEAPPMSQSA